MAQPSKGAATRNIPVSTRLTRIEAAAMDSRRGHLTRAQYLRWLVLKDEKHTNTL